MFLKSLEVFFIDRMDQNDEIVARFMNEKEFNEIVGKTLLREVYKDIHKEAAKESGAPA